MIAFFNSSRYIFDYYYFMVLIIIIAKSSHSEVGMCLRMILGWQLDGHIAMKVKGKIEESYCHCCKNLDNQKYWILQYPQKDLYKIRKQMFDNCVRTKNSAALQQLGHNVMDWIKYHV